MSTSLFVRVGAPVDAAAVIATLAEPDLAMADGELSALRGAWPRRSVLLYLRGRSARGVEVTFDGTQFAIRLLVLSSRADYELAFRLTEALGGDGDVEVETGDTLPARAARDRLGGDWMVRDMAVGVTAVRAALEAGQTVAINGPVRQVELTAPALASDPLEMIEMIRRAQIVDEADDAPIDEATRADDAYEATLLADERARGDTGPPVARVPPPKANMWAMIALFLIIGPLALITRLVTWPLRGWLRDRASARRARARAKLHAGLADATARSAAAPDDVDLRNNRVTWLIAAHQHARADRELLECLRRLDAGTAPTGTKTTPGMVWHNLAVARTRLRLPLLAAAATARATELGFVPTRRPHLVATIATFTVGMFVVFAGLAPD